MSEQLNQGANSQINEIEDDPLAELARIVAGEPELSEPAQVAQEELSIELAELPQELSHELPVEVISTDVVEVDVVVEDASMEAALEEQLMQEFSVDALEEVDIAPPSFVDDINASVEEAAIVKEPIQEPVPEITALEASLDIPVPTSNSEAGFQDDLISALENELAGAEVVEPAFEVPEIIAEVSEVQDIPETIEAAQQVMRTVDDIEIPTTGMQETLEQELSQQFEGQMTQELEPAFDATSVAAVAAVGVAVTTAAVASTSSIEDDLGAAFANEFEQISAELPQAEVLEEIAPEQAVEPIAEVSVEGDPSLEMDFESAFAQEMESTTVPEQAVEPIAEVSVEGDPSLEMDFESAFAQEIEVATVPVAEIPQTQGWEENATLEANASFAAAISPELAPVDVGSIEPNLDVMALDPGHVGSVDEISEIDVVPPAANNNGGGMKYAVAALVIALFAGTIAVGYNFLGGDETILASGTPEIIKAETNPVKIKPKDPGGKVPENQDNASYVDLGGGNSAAVSQETLVSKTEEPAILNTQPAVDPVKSDDRLTSSQDEGATPNAPVPSVLPKVVQTLVVKPDGTIIQQPSSLKPIETASNTITIGDPAIVEVQPVATKVIKKPVAIASIDGANTTGDISVPSASPLPKPVVKVTPKLVVVKKVAAAPKPKKVAPPPVRKSEWVVQVSSQRSPEAAQSSFNTMRNRFSALNGRAMSIQRANVNGATYFRVRVQTASRADANQLCNRLASAGGNCFVTR